MAGIYVERKKLLNEMLLISDTLDSRWWPRFLKSLDITISIRRQLKSIRQLDEHLNRLLDAVNKEGRRNK